MMTEFQDVCRLSILNLNNYLIGVILHGDVAAVLCTMAWEVISDICWEINKNKIQK